MRLVVLVAFWTVVRTGSHTWLCTGLCAVVVPMSVRRHTAQPPCTITYGYALSVEQRFARGRTAIPLRLKLLVAYAMLVQRWIVQIHTKSSAMPTM